MTQVLFENGIEHDVRLDDTELTLKTEEGFTASMADRLANTKRWEVRARDIWFESIGQMCSRLGINHALLAQHLGVDEVLVEDTAVNTDIVVHMPQGDYLLGRGARISISNRIDINGEGLYRLRSETLATVYNERFRDLKDQVIKVIMVYGKIRALMSAVYKEVESAELFEAVLKATRERFQRVDFVVGHIDQNRYEIKVTLTDPAVMPKIGELYGLDGLTPGLRILTSDTGYAANQIAPYWAVTLHGDRGVSWVNAHESIYVKHKGERNDLSRVLAALPDLFLRYQNTVEKFVDLMEIGIDVKPERVIRRACRDLKLGKRTKQTLVERWLANAANIARPTAYDICRHILSAVSLADTPTKLAAIEEKVGKAINLPWKKLAVLATDDDDEE